ncbi:MAG: hypothetical protein MUF54_14615 [Polyangiaceae bacterium]|jgi:hypothetical protein|nr:hypothetical protein [Polyangiaceae bacterium]
MGEPLDLFFGHKPARLAKQIVVPPEAEAPLPAAPETLPDQTLQLVWQSAFSLQPQEGLRARY